MGLTSEQVHWIVGCVIVALSLLLVLYEVGVLRASWLRYLLGGAVLALGLQALLDPLLLGAAGPKGYAAETAQHVVQGVILVALGGLELLRAMAMLQRRIWGFFLPAGIAGVGVLFLLHAQHESSAPAILLLTQHRVTGATLCLAAAAKALAETGHTKARPFATGWLLLLFATGIQFLIYTEGGVSGAHASHG